MTDSIFTRAKERISRATIERYFYAPGAQWKQGARGMEYFTLNPLRDDREIGSFSIREDGVYGDFADPSCTGDLISLLAATQGCTALEAARILADEPEVKEQAKPKAVQKDEPQALVDTCGLQPSVRADLLTEYIDHESGLTAFWIVRHNNHGGKKIIYPMSFDGMSWQKKIWSFYKKRPMLPLKHTEGSILIVEGEKCQDAAQRYFDELGLKCSVTTWHGGIGAVGKVELPPGIDAPERKRILWPDNDAVGIDAMVQLAKRLPNALVLRPPEGKSAGWDVADAIAEFMDISAIIRQVVKGQWPVIEVPDDTLPATLGQEEVSRGIMAADIKDAKFQRTELGAAEQLVALFRHAIRYNYDKGAWAICRDGVWDSDDPACMTPLMKHLLNKLDDGTEAGWKFANKMESSAKINAILSLAAREPGIPIREDQFDHDPYILRCANTALDLRTGKAIEPKPEMFLSKKLTVDYKAGAECPTFKKFLSDITLGREEFVEFMRRWFGLCLSGDMSAQSFAIFYGTGANGKSTLVETIARIMGSYSKSAPQETFIAKSYGTAIPNDVAGLRGARMVLATETEQNARLAESKIKSLTGGDKVSARFMRGEFFEFTPTWKIIISTNHRPRISGGDHGIWRRIILLPFDFVCETSRMDPFLPRKLWEEREGILSWMVSGARDFFADGGGRPALKVPEQAMDATEEYRTDEDVLGRFILEACYTGEEMAGKPQRVAATVMYKSFQAWCDENNETAAGRMSAIAFSKGMRERGYPSVKTNGTTLYKGICPRAVLIDPSRE